ncbi:hypothetical protein [Myceligenerans crystallogenes]|uniref:RCK C-terminal domain-containing protein n=1 Tax=Myceligenerans crystallogenes TaxID=316335 RepID=A0ABN2NFU7_9MICO
MDAESQMRLAAELKDRLDAYVVSSGFRDRFMDAMEWALGVLETPEDSLPRCGPPRCGPPAALDERAHEIAVDSLLFDRRGPGRRTLAERYIDFTRSLTIAEHRILDRWRDGGILGAFEVLTFPGPGRRVAGRNLADGSVYRLVLREAMHHRIAARIRPGALLTGRALPVGDEWLLVGTGNRTPVLDAVSRR